MFHIAQANAAKRFSDVIQGDVEQGDGPDDKRFRRLQKNMQSDAYKVRLSAILVLANLTEAGNIKKSVAVSELINASDDSEDTVHAVAALTLAKLDATMAIPAIYGALKQGGSKGMKWVIRAMLGKLGAVAQKA